MAQSAPTSARPVVIGDILSFNAQPDKFHDLLECTVNWQQTLQDYSEKYMVFKAKNVTAGDTNPLVPVFVQKSYYDEKFGSSTGWVEFPVTEEWQYGQRDETGADRFVVLHDQERKPFQHRFVASWLVKLEGTAHAAASAVGYAYYADKLDDLKNYLGDYLHSFGALVVQSGDVLLIPSEVKWYSFGKAGPRTIKWQQSLSGRSEEYYTFTVVNSTQKGQDVMFFIQKGWWDSDSTSDNHISKIAPKNAKGQYELKIDSKCQYGQADNSGKGRWVVYHNKENKPYQHRFIKSVLHSTVDSAIQWQGLARLFGINPAALDLQGILGRLESIFGDYLHTF